MFLSTEIAICIENQLQQKSKVSQISKSQIFKKKISGVVVGRSFLSASTPNIKSKMKQNTFKKKRIKLQIGYYESLVTQAMREPEYKK